MNTEVSSVTGFAPYQIVFGRKPRANYFLLESLFEQSIMNEEDLPEDLNIESGDEETELRIQDEQEIESTMRNMTAISNDQQQQPAKPTIERNTMDMTETLKRKTKKITNLQLQQQIENTIERENIERQAEEINNSGSTSTYVNNSHHTSVTVSSDEVIFIIFFFVT